MAYTNADGPIGHPCRQCGAEVGRPCRDKKGRIMATARGSLTFHQRRMFRWSK